MILCDISGVAGIFNLGEKAKIIIITVIGLDVLHFIIYNHI